MDDSLDGDDAPASAWREDPFLDGVDDFSDEDQRVDHRGWRVDELAPPADDDGKGFIPGPASLETAGELEDDEAIGDGDDDDDDDDRRRAPAPRRDDPADAAPAEGHDLDIEATNALRAKLGLKPLR
mmetsp:Transcript_5383/g.15948  ORF Transcript_5383/g.15948 Transcript_5383/m.15948 type:complete len:127 (+) Transcript_5383:1490-1870(+)